MKRTYRFAITKNEERQGAWLLAWERELLPTDVEQPKGVSILDIESSADVSAWTTLTAAKRAAASVIDRQRLPWEEVSPKVAYRATVVHRDQ